MQQLSLISSQPQPKSVSAMVKHLKDSEQDFEWYPTTTEILQIVRSDIDLLVNKYCLEENPSVLDCGAGDGSALMYLTDGKRFAIEKSKPLISAMDRNIYIIGADFHQQSLIEKRPDIIFSNPPYMEYSQWSTKIIRESCAGIVYLVIPSRWKQNKDIQAALELRDANTVVIGSFDFLNAERQARAKVDVIRVELKKLGRYSRRNHSDTDPFKIWFEETFKIKAPKSKPSTFTSSISKEEVKNEVVLGRDMISVLTSLYDRDMTNLMQNYKAFEMLDPIILEELGVSFSGIREGLYTKVSGLKNLYWTELFDNLTKITDKLTHRSRRAILDRLTARTDVDFNADNVYAVVVWVIKNANHYLSDQLIELVEQMISKANIALYKSNEKNFSREAWRYNARPNQLDRFSLETRIILNDFYGINSSSFSYEREKYNDLKESGYYLLMDIQTVATNLGFDTADMEKVRDFQWEPNKSYVFHYHDYRTGKPGVLMSVKAFKNGNMHIKFSSLFMARLNVEFGRLKGWLKTPMQAASELDVAEDVARESFGCNLQLTGNNVLQLAFKQAA